MLPVYAKLAILGGVAVVGIGGILFYQHKTAPAVLPTGSPAPAPKAATSLFAPSPSASTTPVIQSSATDDPNAFATEDSSNVLPTTPTAQPSSSDSSSSTLEDVASDIQDVSLLTLL